MADQQEGSQLDVYDEHTHEMGGAVCMQANIRVVGRNGSTQMLKMWLPGLLQLVGDHAKVAIADVDINTLLDAETGLRIQSDA